MTKTEAEADPTTSERRWIGSGHTVFNNKGNSVKQYEPYFSDTSDYEGEVIHGVSPTLYYDALGRNVRTDLPDGTHTKVVFTPWKVSTYDQNDTVLDSQWHKDRGAPKKGDPAPIVNPDDAATLQKRAAWLAVKHANTPKVEHLDTLGRVFLQVDDDGSPDKVKTRFVLNIQGSQVEVWDGLNRQIAINHYDLQQQPLWTQSMDAGNRWMLYNILGQPIQQWNDREFTTRLVYDDLQRNTQTWVSEKGKPEKLVFLTTYGEMRLDPAATNSFGQVIHLHDQAGVTAMDGYDFKGNPLASMVQVAKEYKATLDYAAAASLSTPGDDVLAALASLMEVKPYRSSSTFHALNRPVTQTTPDGSVTKLFYDKANQLKQLKLLHRGVGADREEVKDIQYNAKGQRKEIRYANGVITKYTYDEQTFRLTELESTRNAGSNIIQDLYYYYDPVGNITDMLDKAQQDVFYANRKVLPHSSYQYDAIYRLKKATGREQIALASAPVNTRPEHAYISTSTPASANALQRYERTYEYDKLGNILKVKHTIPPGGVGGWTRHYAYDEPSLLEPGKKNNYLSAITYGSGASARRSAFTHDAHGNMTRMPHLAAMNWDFADQFKKVRLNESGDHEFYTYTMAGGKDFGVRRRKVTKKGATIHDRIYIADYEIYRERKAKTILLERQSLHLQDDTGRIALFETRTTTGGQSLKIDYRYQLNNHLGSASLELDESGNLISYEEYYPFGGSSYRSGKNAAEVKAKRYRYAGKERDEATGLDYYGARYYGSWLGRWTSSDPSGFVDGFNLFQFVSNNPMIFIDPVGLEKVTHDSALGSSATFEQLKSAKVPNGWTFNPEITENNYKSRWTNEGGGYWDVLVENSSDSQSINNAEQDIPPANNLLPLTQELIRPKLNPSIKLELLILNELDIRNGLKPLPHPARNPFLSALTMDDLPKDSILHLQPHYQSGGALGGKIVFISGLVTASLAGQELDGTFLGSMTAGSSALFGVGEATASLIYIGGAIGKSSQLLKWGIGGGTLFGGLSAAVGFARSANKAYDKDDKLGVGIFSIGAAGGVALAIKGGMALVSTAAFPAVITIGATIAIAAAVGYSIYQYFNPKHHES